MRLMIPVLVLAAMTAAPAFAQEATSAATKAQRTVYVCDASAMTRRAFTREFGTMEFVKADAVVARRDAWAAPKCVTPTEARRLKQLASLR